jgi:hypothetical protein
MELPVVYAPEFLCTEIEIDEYGRVKIGNLVSRTNYGMALGLPSLVVAVLALWVAYLIFKNSRHTSD